MIKDTNNTDTPYSKSNEFASAILETMDDMLAASRATDAQSWYTVIQNRDKIIKMQREWVEWSERNAENFKYIKEKLLEIEDNKC